MSPDEVSAATPSTPGCAQRSPHLNIWSAQVLLFKQYDTRAEAKNLRTVFHSAIDDPLTREDAPPRYTIETGVNAYFEPDVDKAARVARFVGQINSTYPDGTESTWFTGPIEGYVPPPAAKL